MELSGLRVEIADDRGDVLESHEFAGEELKRIMEENGGEVPFEIPARTGSVGKEPVHIGLIEGQSSMDCAEGKRETCPHQLDFQHCMFLLSYAVSVQTRPGTLPAGKEAPR